MTTRSRRYGFALWLDDGRPSGANRRLRALVRELPGLLDPNERLIFLCGNETPEPEPHPLCEVLRVDIPAIPTLRRAFAESRQLPSLAAELRLSLVDVQALPVPGIGEIPTVCTIHDLRDLGPFARRPRWVYRCVLRRSARHVEAFVTPSRATAAQLRDEIGADSNASITVVPNAPDPAFFDLQREPNETPILLHVGHLERRKNLGRLVEALAILKTENLELCLIGNDGGERNRLTQLAESLGVAERVRFEGVIDEGEMWDRIRICSLVAIPSLDEGYGLPAIEALAAGCPTLVSAHGALPEVVGEAGQVVASDRAEDWARAIDETIELSRDPHREPLRIEVRKRRAARYSWTESARQLIELWRATADAVQAANR
ncbi:MAG: glycosyltransferase family 1 protein [Planctomycetota bacterium]